MRRLSEVFIGSSSEKKKLAIAIQKKLEKLPISVLPWWSDRAFRPGDFTLPRLIQLAGLCEGSVFVFGADDKIWFRGTKGMSVRDNVLLEYGLFVGQTGPRHTLIVAESSVKLPSDTSGMMVMFYQPDDTLSATASRVVNHFTELLREFDGNSDTGDTGLAVKTDWNLKIHDINGADVTSELYEGRTGARAWSGVAGDIGYVDRTQSGINGQKIAELVNNRPVSTIISFGPGLGGMDNEITSHLSGNLLREYIPIDTNEYFLINSAKAVAQGNPQVECKHAFRCNFETDTTFLSRMIKDHSTGNRLFLMAGGTFGNSRRSVSAQLKTLYGLMEAGDLFVFDLFCHGDGYRVDVDPMASVDLWSNSVEKFFAGSVGFRPELNDSLQDFVAKIEASIIVGTSGLTKTTTIVVREKSTKQIIVEIRRFDADEIISAIGAVGFTIGGSLKVTEGTVERHVILAVK
jgi:hypothetical protein